MKPAKIKISGDNDRLYVKWEIGGLDPNMVGAGLAITIMRISESMRQDDERMAQDFMTAVLGGLQMLISESQGQVQVVKRSLDVLKSAGLYDDDEEGEDDD